MKRHGTYNAEGAEQTRLEITFGCPAFLCLMGCVWTWRGMLLFLCALLLHEAGHAIVLRLVHVRVKAVRLGFGDVEMETAPLGYWEELLSAWAGPCVNFLLYLALWRIAPAFAAVNLLLGAYNLLPVLPLDGGQDAAGGIISAAAGADRLADWARMEPARDHVSAGVCAVGRGAGGAAAAGDGAWIVCAAGAARKKRCVLRREQVQ